MDEQALVDHLEETYETELSRLGSSKAMYAVTDGEMDTEAVLAAMADRAVAAAETFESWALDSTDPLAAEYEAVATSLRDLARRMADHADGIDPADRPTPLEEYLRDLEGTDRLAGSVAWAAIMDRTLSQAVGFFVGNADTQGANLFRDIRTEVAGYLDDVEVDLADADTESMKETAGAAVTVAYRHYVETLEDMGIKVKPVC